MANPSVWEWVSQETLAIKGLSSRQMPFDNPCVPSQRTTRKPPPLSLPFQ